MRLSPKNFVYRLKLNDTKATTKYLTSIYFLHGRCAIVFVKQAILFCCILFRKFKCTLKNLILCRGQYKKFIAHTCNILHPSRNQILQLAYPMPIRTRGLFSGLGVASSWQQWPRQKPGLDTISYLGLLRQNKTNINENSVSFDFLSI